MRKTAPRKAAKRKAAPPARARKNLRLDQALLDEAKRALGTESETEAVTIALQRVVDKRRFIDGFLSIAGRRMFDESRIND